ncbi:metalloprotease [Mycena vulgaris]|nr:metalloprotease [Mycena vulgaris]
MLYPATSSLLLLFSAASAGFASPIDIPFDAPGKNLTAHAVRHLRCGTHMALDQIIVAEEQFMMDQAEFLELEQNNGVHLNVHWTVVSKDGTLSGGDIPDSQIAAQVKELNANSAGSFIWTLASISRVVNADWFDNAGPSTAQQTDMKTAHRKGGRRDLNVYSVGFTSGSGEGLLGYATFPSKYKSNPMDDGVVLLFSTVPGGSMTHYNLGRTLTHEVGHWLGLYHTFQGGCAERNPSSGGDYVSDTPAEASGASGCPTNRTTCSTERADPIHNFMDYSYDECMNQFTDGQLARAVAQMTAYRPK